MAPFVRAGRLKPGMVLEGAVGEPFGIRRRRALEQAREARQSSKMIAPEFRSVQSRFTIRTQPGEGSR
jgi:hypothetical protein